MDLELCQLHIDTEFLYALIKEGVYIRQPLGFSDGTPEVYCPKRCLYGLNQPPRVQHTPAGLACREWVTAVYLGPVHLYLPHKDSVRRDCTLRG
jgi:hypothetical protein